MAKFDLDFIRRLKEKVNIVDVAASYITLEKRGATYWACCPFHHEKTPSFAINEAGQFYHCFGCSASGDVIRLVSELESTDFMGSVKILAARANMELPKLGEDDDRTAENKRKRDACLKILNETAHFYLNNLNSGKADEHIEYILSRKIPSSVVKSFGFGASLNFNDLPKYLLSKGYLKQDIVDSGVVNEVEGRLSDAMGGRLIFPIINSFNEVIAFSGRILQKSKLNKYVNTRKTLIFDKRNNLYNINLLKKLKISQPVKQLIMVEGYMDVISLYSSGFKNVVASMGTSLTQEQARLAKRYVDTVLLCYDGDSAGINANLRGGEILKSAGLNVKVVPLPDELDPDDVIKLRGKEVFQKCLDEAIPYIDYKLKVLKNNYDLTKTEEKRKYVSEAIAIIKTADSEAEKEELLKQLRDSSGITLEALRRDLDSSPKAKPNAVEVPAAKKKDESDAIKKASRFVIASILFDADCAKGADIDGIPLSDGVHKILLNYVRGKRMMEEPVRLSEVFDLFFDPETPEYEELERILDVSEGNGLKGEVGEKYFKDCIKRLKIHAIDNEIAEVRAKLVGVTDLKTQTEIAQKLYELTQKKQQLKNRTND